MLLTTYTADEKNIWNEKWGKILEACCQCYSLYIDKNIDFLFGTCIGAQSLARFQWSFVWDYTLLVVHLPSTRIRPDLSLYIDAQQAWKRYFNSYKVCWIYIYMYEYQTARGRFGPCWNANIIKYLIIQLLQRYPLHSDQR